jgi:hypothetical protein
MSSKTLRGGAIRSTLPISLPPRRRVPWQRDLSSARRLLSFESRLRRRLLNLFRNRSSSGVESVKTSKAPRFLAIPSLKIGLGSVGKGGDNSEIIHDPPVGSMIGSPKDWCLNSSITTCLRVRGNSMLPLIYDGGILVVDSSQIDLSKLTDRLVIAWHKHIGLTLSRLQRHDRTAALQPENRKYESIVLNRKQKWKILAKVLWWIGKAP